MSSLNIRWWLKPQTIVLIVGWNRSKIFLLHCKIWLLSRLLCLMFLPIYFNVDEWKSQKGCNGFWFVGISKIVDFSVPKETRNEAQIHVFNPNLIYIILRTIMTEFIQQISYFWHNKQRTPYKLPPPSYSTYELEKREIPKRLPVIQLVTVADWLIVKWSSRITTNPQVQDEVVLSLKTKWC